jgi:hypothetical protein
MWNKFYLIDTYIKVFFHTLSALQCRHPVSHGQHPVEIPMRASMLLLTVVTTSLIRVFRSPVTLVA